MDHYFKKQIKANHNFRQSYDSSQEIGGSAFEYRDKNSLVPAIPRGAVPMAKVIA